MIRAKHIMSKKVLTVTEDSKIRHVMKLLSENRVTGLPVVSEDMDLLGIVTEKDILKVLLYGKDIKTKTVKDLMATDIVFFEEDEDLMTIFRTLVEDNFRRVPIVSNGKITGIISRTDIINFLAEKSSDNSF